MIASLRSAGGLHAAPTLLFRSRTGTHYSYLAFLVSVLMLSAQAGIEGDGPPGQQVKQMAVILQRGNLELCLMPEVGGSVKSLRFAGESVLRSASPEAIAAKAPLETAGFPLIPFSGRIANGHFQWNGRDVALKQNFLPEPHAIHGHGWAAVWSVDDSGTDHATLTYRHDADDWPWSYLARQTFQLRHDGLDLTLSLKNLSAATMPAGLGWHPYFPRQDARIELPVSGIWRSDENMIPTELTAPCGCSDLRRMRRVDDLVLDNAFATDPARARIEWPARGLSVEMVSDRIFSHVVVFTPPGQNFFCIEPVSHAPDAVNSRQAASVTGLVSLPPDGELSGTIRLTVSKV